MSNLVHDCREAVLSSMLDLDCGAERQVTCVVKGDTRAHHCCVADPDSASVQYVVPAVFRVGLHRIEDP